MCIRDSLRWYPINTDIVLDQKSPFRLMIVIILIIFIIILMILIIIMIDRCSLPEVVSCKHRHRA